MYVYTLDTSPIFSQSMQLRKIRKIRQYAREPIVDHLSATIEAWEVRQEEEYICIYTQIHLHTNVCVGTSCNLCMMQSLFISYSFKRVWSASISDATMHTSLEWNW